jgi:hypothetical protein
VRNQVEKRATPPVTLVQDLEAELKTSDIRNMLRLLEEMNGGCNVDTTL